MDVSPDELPNLYSWVDRIPLSKPKRNIARDFSDGVLTAEIVAHYCPKLVEVHNYTPANGLANKISNWTTLNHKVFKRLNFSLTKDDIEAVANAEPQMIERILKLLKYKIAKYKPNSNKGHNTATHDETTPRNRAPGPSSRNAIKTEQPRPMNFRHGTASKSPQRIITPHHENSQNESYGSLSPKQSLSSSMANGVPENFAEKLAQKDAQIRELQETVQLLEAKVIKLEQLVRLKDHKIQFITEKANRPTHT